MRLFNYINFVMIFRISGNPAGKPRNFFPSEKGVLKKIKICQIKTLREVPDRLKRRYFFVNFFSSVEVSVASEKKVYVVEKVLFLIDKFLWINTNFWAFSVADCVVYAKVVKVIFTQIVSLFLQNENIFRIDRA